MSKQAQADVNPKGYLPDQSFCGGGGATSSAEFASSPSGRWFSPSLGRRTSGDMVGEAGTKRETASSEGANTPEHRLLNATAWDWGRD